MTVLALLLASLAAQAGDGGPDLLRIGHMPPKYRVQDFRNPVVDELLRAPEQALPFLVSRLTDRRRAPRGTIDFWPGGPTVSVIALSILSDFFTRPDLATSTIPEMGWDSVLERRNSGAPASEVYDAFIRKHGEKGLQAKVRAILAKHRLRWNPTERCMESAP
jgi:hypothetical protein